MTDHHHMTLVETYPTGAERWRCNVDECRREIVMIWGSHRRVPLVKGDEAVIHTCMKNDMPGLTAKTPTVQLVRDSGLWRKLFRGNA